MSVWRVSLIDDPEPFDIEAFHMSLESGHLVFFECGIKKALNAEAVLEVTRLD